MRYNYHGTGVAMITPFDNSGEIDFNALEKIVHFLSDGGIDYLVVLGTTGESATLSHEEKQKIFSFVAGANNGKLPLIAGIGGNDTRGVISDMKSYDLDGYSAILSVAPYYNKPSQEGMFQHYRAISEASPLPVMMYNVPGRTGMNVSAETTQRIAEECRNVFATKEASGNFEQIMQIIKYKPAGFEVISGDDAITLPIMACGAIGVISVVANAYPRIFSDMVRLCLAGDYVAAQKFHYQLTDIIPTLFAEGSPSGVKAYMQELGICDSFTRLPVAGVSLPMLKRIKSLAELVKKQYVF